jgi:hypothetical protein
MSTETQENIGGVEDEEVASASTVSTNIHVNIFFRKTFYFIKNYHIILNSICGLLFFILGY